MKMMDFKLFVAVLGSLTICTGAMTVPPPLDDWHSLDPTNLRTLNRESRKALLDIITRELGLVRRTLDDLRPQLSECQNKTVHVMGKCIDCVDNMCQDRRRACKGRANVVVPPGGGVSVSGQRDSEGRHVVTVCALLQDNSQSCQTIMNPDGVLVSSIENMGDNLMVHLRGAVNDMGGNSVGTFVNGMQSFIGSYRPLSGDSSNVNKTEWNAILTSMNEQYNQITRDVNDQMFDMGQQMQQGMNMFSGSFGQDMQQFSNNMNRQMQNLFQSMTSLFQQPTTPSNLFMQPQQQNMFMINQQPRNILPQLGDTALTMPIQPTVPSEVFSRPFNDVFRQTTARNMFRAPPTPNTSQGQTKSTHSPQVTTQRPEVPSGPGPIRPSTGALPSVVNIDSIIGRSDTGNFPNVLNINSRIGVQDTFQNVMDVMQPTPPSVFRASPDVSINSPLDTMSSGRSPSNLLSMNPPVLNRDPVGSLGTSFSGMNIPDVLNFNTPIQSQISRSDQVGSRSQGNIPSVLNINSRIGNLGILSDTGTKNGLTTQNAPSILSINSQTENQKRVSGPRMALNQNDPQMIQNPWMTGTPGNSFVNDMNKFASDLQRSLSNLFTGGMFGRKKRSAKRPAKQAQRTQGLNPGGVPIDFSPKPTAFTPTMNPLSKETYIKANRWNSFLKSLDTDSIPVGGNPEDGIAIRSRKSVRANLSIEPYMSETRSNSVISRKSKRKSTNDPHTAGGLLVYTDPASVSPHESSGKEQAPMTNTDKARVTKSVATKRLTTAVELGTTTTTPVQMIASSPPPELSSYPTKPLKIELQRIIKALTMKTADKTISAYPFDPTVRTTPVPPTTAPTTYVTSSVKYNVKDSTSSTIKEPRITTSADRSFQPPVKMVKTTDATKLILTTTLRPDVRQNMEANLPTVPKKSIMPAQPVVSSDVIDRPILSTQAPPRTAAIITDVVGQTPPPPDLELPLVRAQNSVFKNSPSIPTTNGEECGTIYLNSTSCLRYTEMCSACADYIDSRKGDILRNVCGGVLVEDMIKLRSKMAALQAIYDQVITSTDILTKVEFDRTSGDMLSLAFTRVKATARIKGKLVNFMSSFPLRLLDLPTSATNMAEQLWRLWNDGNTFR